MQSLMRRHIIILTIVTLAVVLVLCGGYEYLRMQATWPIKKVTIVGDYAFIGKDALQAELKPFVSHGLLNARSSDMSRFLKQRYPSLASVSVSYGSLHSIVVSLKRHIPVAVLTDGWVYAKDGSFFKPKLPLDTRDVPHFDIDRAHIKTWLLRYQQWQKQLTPLKLHITQVHDTTAGWRLQLNGELWLVLGNTKVERRFERFIAAYPLLLERAPPHKNMSSADMRYQYGIAVRWSRSQQKMTKGTQK